MNHKNTCVCVGRPPASAGPPPDEPGAPPPCLNTSPRTTGTDSQPTRTPHDQADHRAGLGSGRARGQEAAVRCGEECASFPHGPEGPFAAQVALPLDGGADRVVVHVRHRGNNRFQEFHEVASEAHDARWRANGGWGFLRLPPPPGGGLENQIDSRVFWSAFPVGVTLTMGRFLTYFSYQTVAASLTHTVKASSPVFTVALLFLFYGKCQPMWTLLSLIPIILGVILSAVTEMEIKADGFAAAVAAGLISTVQALYAKSSLKNSHHPMVFHMCSCLWAALLLIPSSLVLEGQPMELIDTIHDLSDQKGQASINKVLFASFVCYWGQNLTSILVLSQMHVLSHQVANVSRRFALIISTMVYFGNAITVSKMIGILMALSGFFWFSFSKKLKVAKVSRIPDHQKAVKIGRPKLCDPPARDTNDAHVDVEMASIPKKS
eukprot:CAMPEP_0167811174 /NCGR_PEP_ID=MMETSP0112_2-20121227/518_1 /TAXON_ID=91324 /ORGANISM="Lotharella globosa, Strain CCCM811" /LENGTH=434 /DNA_ID=CAMNT_0007709849 /DNA_START=63 /DNA_END=1368 /DNA_ORIENTATION=-